MDDPTTLGAPREPLAHGVISLHVAEKRFGSGAAVLKDVALTMQPGERVSIVGPSGVGKSTLLRIAAGLDTDFRGVREVPGRVAMVFQEPNLLPWRSVLQNLQVIHPALGADAARTLLARTGLDGKEDAWPGQLSLGQQRRLALARAMGGTPDFLILDEPFTSLDADTHRDIVGLTKTLIEDRRLTTLLVTHDPAEARALADRTLALEGAPARLRETRI